MRAESGLKILIAAWAPFHAGAEVAALRLAIGLLDAGHKVVVLLGTKAETWERMREAGLDVRHIPLAFTDKLHWWRYQSAQRAVSRLLNGLRPDIVHANDLPTSQMIGNAVNRRGIPLVCHHRWIFEAAAIQWLNKYGARRHAFVSSALRDELCARSPLLAGSPGEVVHDGLELPVVPTEDEKTKARQQLGLSLERTLVLFAGQIIERKGVADLLHAWAHLTPRWIDRADLLLVGDDLENKGAYRHQMETLAAELGVTAQFHGYQRNVSTWLTACDMVVVPSHAEPLGNATLEAMAYAKPVIGCRVGGIPEMIDDNVTGLLVSPHSPLELSRAIEHLLFLPTLRDELGSQARARCAKDFALSVHVRNMVRQYKLAMEVGKAVIPS